MSQNYDYKKLTKQSTYPTGLVDGSSVLVVAADGSLRAFTIAGLQGLISTQAQTNNIDGNLTVYGTIFTPTPVVNFQPILSATDCGSLAGQSVDAFGVGLSTTFVSDLNFTGALQINDLGALA
jgi:hypothetical protein